MILWYFKCPNNSTPKQKNLLAARNSKRKVFPNILPIVSFPSFHSVCVFLEMEKIVQRRWGRCLPHCWCCHALKLGRDVKYLGLLKSQSSPTPSHLGFHFLLQEHTYYSIKFVILLLVLFHTLISIWVWSVFLNIWPSLYFQKCYRKAWSFYQGRSWGRGRRCTGVCEKSVRRCQRGGSVGLWMNASQSWF